jgi:hypothetical protein
MWVEAKHDCGSGPVILEEHGKGWRAICCACWTHGQVKADRKSAAEAWVNKSARVVWRDESQPKLVSQ